MSPFLSDTLLRTQSDERLAALAAAGRDRAFEVLVERHRRPLLLFARHAVGAGRAEDVVQQALLQAWRSLQAGAEVKHVRGWLHQIVRHAAWKTARSAADLQLHAGLVGSPGPQDEVERRMEVSAVVASFAAMPERQRAAIVHTVLEGQSQSEVAKSLGLSEGAVRQLVHRGRSFLRAAATAVVPMPLAEWAASAGSSGPVAERIAEGVAGAGSAGLAGLIAKGGIAVVAAGAVATGVVSQAVPRHHARHPRVAVAARPAARARVDVVQPAAAQSGGTVTAADHPHGGRDVGSSGPRRRGRRGSGDRSGSSGSGDDRSGSSGSRDDRSGSSGSRDGSSRSSDDSSSSHDGTSGTSGSGSRSGSSDDGGSSSPSGDGSGGGELQTTIVPPLSGSSGGDDSSHSGSSGGSDDSSISGD
jgi:RNA polymerase sigma factor (sigma-70 family)